jgi:Glycosyltransferase Family 4
MSTVQELTGSEFSTAEPAFKSKPRILYLVTRAERGGAQSHILDLALGMRTDFDVEIATGEEGFLTEACREQGIPAHVVKHLAREIRPVGDLLGLTELVRLMQRVKPDLLHAHTFKAGFLGRLAAKVLKIPAVYSVHMWPFGRAVPRSWRVAAPLCERLAARCCNRIISVSELGVRTAAQYGICDSSHVVAIWNGIPDHKERARLDHGDDLSCTMVARFS